MSQALPISFISLFDAEVKQAYQGTSRLMGTVRTRKNVEAATYRFPKMGKGLAQPRVYQTDVVPMNVGHDGAVATMSSWIAPEYTDIFAQKQVNFDERQELVKLVSSAMGRRLDQIIIDSGLLPYNGNTIAVGVGGNNAMNMGKVRAIKEFFDDKGVPESDRHAAVSARCVNQLLGSLQVTSADYQNVRALVNGDVDTLCGIKMHMIETRAEGGLPKTGNNRTIFAWHREAVGLICGGLDMSTTIDWIAEKQSWLVCGRMMAGAVGIDTDGILQLTIDESVEVNPA